MISRAKRRQESFLKRPAKNALSKAKRPPKALSNLMWRCGLKMDDTDFINALSEMEGVQSAALVSYNGDYMG